MPDLREQIQSALAAFTEKPLREAATALLGTLGYESDRTLPISTPQQFCEQLDPQNRLTPGQRESLDTLTSLHLLFQLTDAELTFQREFLDDPNAVQKTKIESYLFFAAGLPPGRYTRTELSSVVRAINKPLPMPALVLFRHGDAISLGIIHRRLHKRDQAKDVLEKVTLIKDIAFAAPHRAHLEILNDLSLPALIAKQPSNEEITSFVSLHKAWQKTLDIQTLNKRFFIEIRNWFYWARVHVGFPSGAKKDADQRDSEALIRLLTRMIFCWFLREKGMLPGELFAPRKIENLLRDWKSADCDGDKTGRYYKAILQNLFFATLAT